MPGASEIRRNMIEEEEGESSSANTVTEDLIIPSMETPRVLTRSIIPTLTHGLDASDVLEIYALVRTAPLHGIANSTIKIQKMALGIRFRPKGSDLINPYNTKTPMELTLEYGPQRVGSSLNDEAMPIVQEEESSSFLAWDNSGKVYFTQKIVTENFLSSHFMASITGVVLSKLLTEALEYAEKRKVYQPFAVFSDDGRQLLRSSSSSDFTWFVWSHLARLGVEIEPILPPSIYEARIYAKSVTKITPDQSVTHRAATFYQRLYTCLESIGTNNYGSFPSYSSLSEQPTTEPVPIEDSSTNTGSDNDSSSNIDEEDLELVDADDFTGNQGNELDDPDNNDGHRLVEDIREEPETEDETNNKGEEFMENNPPGIDSNVEGESATQLDNDEENDDSSEEITSISQEESSLSPPFSKSSADVSNQTTSSTIIPIVPTTAPSNQPSSIDNQTIIPTESEHDNVQKAQNAANEAQKAADEAKTVAHTEGDTKAADAAQAAADAAFAAADATSNAVSQAAMDSLLSGDGTMMSSIVAKCFSDPKYRISSIDSNGTVTTEFYLFRDSSSYYKLDLASPYLDVVKMNRQLPNAATMVSDFGSGGDALDWTLALSLVVLALLMVLLVCQQMGNRWVDAIFKCQRWFFNPRKYDYEGDIVSGVQSGSHFFFGESGIPISMGGRRSSYSPRRGENLQEVIVDESLFENGGDDDDDDDDDNDYENELQVLSIQPNGHKRHPSSSLEVEMANLRTPDHNQNGRALRSLNTWRKNSDPGSSSSEEDEVALEHSLPIPERLLRNPDLVELPHLKYKSKVAIPVGDMRRSASSSFDGGSVNSTTLDQTDFF